MGYRGNPTLRTKIREEKNRERERERERERMSFVSPPPHAPTHFFATQLDSIVLHKV
jgi:hypothetical protein